MQVTAIPQKELGPVHDQAVPDNAPVTALEKKNKEINSEDKMKTRKEPPFEKTMICGTGGRRDWKSAPDTRAGALIDRLEKTPDEVITNQPGRGICQQVACNKDLAAIEVCSDTAGPDDFKVTYREIADCASDLRNPNPGKGCTFFPKSGPFFDSGNGPDVLGQRFVSFHAQSEDDGAKMEVDGQGVELCYPQDHLYLQGTCVQGLDKNTVLWVMGMRSCLGLFLRFVTFFHV